MDEELNVNGNIIKFKTEYIKNSGKLILMVHGFGGEGFEEQFEKVAELFYKAGYNTARFLFSGYTEDMGLINPSIKRQVKELSEIIKYFSARGFKIIIFAQSLGCPTALSSGLKKVEALILLAPAINPAKVLGREFIEFDKNAIIKLENNQEFIFSYTNRDGKKIERVITPLFWKELKEMSEVNYEADKPILIFQGRKDTTVEPKDTENFFKKLNAKKKIYFTEGPHVQIKDEKIRKFIAEKSVKWLNELNL